ncbi:HWE histidine kinase domain-containing protein [Sphingomonas sp. RB3P16]|uniref:HWE histidine kinase domain-containing protein n=1 Tax=Parasphingomonas frigoris TaxID=3096163 RepID=UPI002FC5EFCB
MYTEDLYRLLRTGHVQLQGIVDTVADPLLVLDAGLCVQAASRSFFSTFGVDRDDTIGRPIYELGNGQWDIPQLRQLLTEIIPKTTALINYEVQHVFPELGSRTMLLTARTLFHPDTVSHTMLLSIIDATDSTRRDAAKDLLLGEVRHRMKNLLGVAQSMARQMPAEGVSGVEYRDTFLSRFAALIEAEDIAFTEQEETGLERLLERIFAPFASNPEAIMIEPSEPIDLAPRKIMALGMVFHELATNAAKYGALSVPGGQVRVGWQVESTTGLLRLTWTECGGPAVIAPVGTGYGTTLIQSTVSYGLRGTLEQEFAANGLRAEILIPIGSATPPR